MKTKLVAIIISIVVVSLIFASVQPSSAVNYYGHDGSIDKYLTKVKVEPYKGKKDLWVYIIKACATDRTLAVAGVILKSDIGNELLGVNKNIRKGDCSYYGAVMNAKNGKTLGAELIEKHQALDKMQKILKDLPTMNKSLRKISLDQYYELERISGFYLR